jgi:small subunit ribosomal protein S21
MSRNQNNNNTGKLTGIRVEVVGDNLNAALRKFKKKVDQSGILMEVMRRQYYEKPTTERKRKKAMARSRWLKKQRTIQTLK